VYRLFDKNPGIRSGWRFFLWGATQGIFGSIGFALAEWKMGLHLFDAWQNLLFIIIFACATASVMYVGSFVLIALMTGFTDWRSWPVTIEVDAAPPNRECTLKSYNDLGEVETTSLRHGIYEFPAVQREVASIIRSIALSATSDQLQ